MHRTGSRPPYRSRGESIVRFEDTLFSEEVINDLATESGTDAHVVLRSLGIRPPVDEHERRPTEGASVRIDERQLAIQSIMSTYNQLNKYHGAVASFDHNSVQDEYQLEGLGKKVTLMAQDTEHDYDTLAAVTDMKRIGFSDAIISEAREGTKNRLMTKYGPGNAFAKDRTAFVKTIQTSDYKVDRDKPKRTRK